METALSTIIDNIERHLTCPKFQKYSHLIEIDTWQNIGPQMSRNKAIAEMGFGFCITNYLEADNFSRLIIVNMENCKRFKLSEGEIAAIICHELGHLLNSPTLVEEPTQAACILEGSNYIKVRDEIQLQNFIQEEMFADAYASYNGYGAELISTFYKQNQSFAQQMGFFDIRVDKINSKEILEGFVMPLYTRGNQN